MSLLKLVEAKRQQSGKRRQQNFKLRVEVEMTPDETSLYQSFEEFAIDSAHIHDGIDKKTLARALMDCLRPVRKRTGDIKWAYRKVARDIIRILHDRRVIDKDDDNMYRQVDPTIADRPATGPPWVGGAGGAKGLGAIDDETS